MKSMFVWSYKNYTITLIDSKYQISYPNSKGYDVYTKTLEKAYQFIDEMEGEEIR